MTRVRLGIRILADNLTNLLGAQRLDQILAHTQASRDVPILMVSARNQELDRVAGLDDQVAAGITTRTPDGRTPGAQLDEIRKAIQDWPM